VRSTSPRGIGAAVKGHTTGLPSLHPWANRLGSPEYRASGLDVSLRGLQGLHRDEQGLPMHGTMLGERDWDVLEARAGSKASTLVARFDFGARDDLLRSFPFPHELQIAAVVRGRVLAVTTTVRATGPDRVPISFGWHPYFHLPGVRRSATNLILPKRFHLSLDERQLPNGDFTTEAAESRAIGRRTFDDAFRLVPKADRGKRGDLFGLEGGGKRLTVRFDENYPYAQVYAPPGKPFVALEPMTAPTNGLVTNDFPRCKAGKAFSATFTIKIDTGS
jgi:aldose 1-epimerase